MKEKILLALSDQNLVSLLSTQLAGEGYMVSMATTGNEALKKMQTETPDLLLIDVVLPEKNGYDVLAEKSLDREITKIPVIVVSNAGATLEMKRLPSTAAMKDYVVKPYIDPIEVLQKVEIAFGRTYIAHAHPHVDPAAQEKKPVGKKILWAEDDKFLSMILVRKFQSSGHTVLKASDGMEAMKIVETENPDIVILDIMLPGMDGFEILQKMKMNEKMRTVPVIMLSNLSQPGDIEKAKRLGAQKFLVKAAVSLDEIVHEVDSLLK